MTTRQRGEDPSTSRLRFIINLFITILIGLKLPTFLFYVWTEDIIIFLFGPFTGILLGLGGEPNAVRCFLCFLEMCYDRAVSVQG